MFTEHDLKRNIRVAIVKSGLTQRLVAEKAGFTANQFCSMLKDRKTIKAEYIPRIAKAIGVEIIQLFNED